MMSDNEIKVIEEQKEEDEDSKLRQSKENPLPHAESQTNAPP